MAGTNGATGDGSGEKTARQGSSSPPQVYQVGLHPPDAQDISAGSGAPDHQPSAQQPADQSASTGGPQASSLNQALYLWLSKRPSWFQNTVLVTFGFCTLLLFFTPVVIILKAVWDYLPKPIPPIQVVLCNASDRDEKFSTTGDFTIWAPVPKRGKLDLKPVQEVETQDGDAIPVPANGGRVKAEATIRQPRKFHRHYKDGGCPLTMTLAADTERTATQIDPFSKASLKKQWSALIPARTTTSRVINVCFETAQVNGLLEDETRSFKDDLTDELRRDGCFGSITPEYFDEIWRRDMPQGPSSVHVKVSVAICQGPDDQKMIKWKVADTRRKIQEDDFSCPYKEDTAEMVATIVLYVTQAIRQAYPITGWVREVLYGAEVLKDGTYVEIGIGKLAGVRDGMTLHVYCGKIAETTDVGDVEITRAWTDTCEGRLAKWRGPDQPDAVRNLLVSSGVLE
jgi:hypothetical protein